MSLCCGTAINELYAFERVHPGSDVNICRTGAPPGVTLRKLSSTGENRESAVCGMRGTVAAARFGVVCVAGFAGASSMQDRCGSRHVPI